MSDEPQIIEGDLQSTELPQVLKLLAVRRATGILTIQGADDIVAVSILKGHIVTADSLNQTQEESLSEVLTSQNLVSKADFDAVVSEQQSSGGNLGELLVARGLMTNEKLLESLRTQTYRLMLQVLAWRRGEFKFYGGDEVSYEKGIVPMSIDEMLIRALADIGKQSGLEGEMPKLDAVYRKVPPRGSVQILGRDGDGGPGIWITELQLAFRERMDGTASAFDVARSLGAGRFRTLFSLHQLVQTDLIEVVPGSSGQAVRAPAGPPAPGPAPLAGARPPSSAGSIPLARSSSAPPPAPPSAASASLPPSSTAPQPSSVPLSSVLQSSVPQSSVPQSPVPLSSVPLSPEPSWPTTAASGEAERDRAERAEAAEAETASAPRDWLGPALAAVLALVLLLALFQRPASYFLPFPWQETRRLTVERQIRQTLFLKIDRAVGTFFLMKEKYPRSLQELIELDLLASVDTGDPSGLALEYKANEQSYEIDLVGADGAVETRPGTITGDFVLDQELFTGRDSINPLVLLD